MRVYFWNYANNKNQKKKEKRQECSTKGTFVEYCSRNSFTTRIRVVNEFLIVAIIPYRVHGVTDGQVVRAGV